MATVIKIEGLNEAIESLTKFGESLQSLEPLMQLIGLEILSSVNRNFMASGRPDAWVPLSPITIRRRKGTGTPEILRDKGHLMNSVTIKDYSDEVGDNIFTLTPLSVEVGTNVPYAAVHQYGGTSMLSSFVVVPARPFLLLQEADKETIMKFVQDDIDEKIKEEGL